MGSISTTEAQGLYTKMIIDTYVERISPLGLLRSFFPSVSTPTKHVSIEVQRGTEKIAVDVVRGTEGNRNKFGRSTEKIYEPPYFREYFDVTSLDLYDRLFGATAIDDRVFSSLINDMADKTAMLQDKIERSYELMCAQVLTTGIVTMVNGDSIDFKRKAASIVNNAAYYFSANNTYFAPFQAGAEFLRTKGKARGGIFNAIMGQSAFNDMLVNTTFKDRQSMFHMNLDGVAPPQADAVGSVLMGYVTAGSYRINIWTYPEYYDDAAGNSTKYIDDDLVIMLPEKPRFKLAYAAVPQLISPGQSPFVGPYMIGEFEDQRKKTREIHVESAGLPIPVAVDQIFTFRGVAA